MKGQPRAMKRGHSKSLFAQASSETDLLSSVFENAVVVVGDTVVVVAGATA
jgi:hypothetical protein